MNDFMQKFAAYPMGQKLLFVSVIMIMMVVAFYLLHYQPHQEEVAGKRQQLTQLQNDREKLDLLKANREEVLSRLEGLKRQLLIAREQLPVSAEVPSLLQRIHNQAKTAGLEITKFKRIQNQTQAYYTEIPVEMSLVGAFDELANFFYYVGRMTRIVNVKDMSLVRTVNDWENLGELKVTALATTFMYNAGGEDADAKAGKKK